MKRYAIVRNARSRREAEAYLPDNYEIVEERPTEDCLHCRLGKHTPESNLKHPFTPKMEFVIEGEDYAGWTLDGYVIPRYSSGSIWATEQFLHVEDTGTGETGPQVSTWLEDEPQRNRA